MRFFPPSLVLKRAMNVTRDINGNVVQEEKKLALILERQGKNIDGKLQIFQIRITKLGGPFL